MTSVTNTVTIVRPQNGADYVLRQKDGKKCSVYARLNWICDRPHMEDIRVTVGCKDCHDVQMLMARTALTAWLSPFHQGHDVWMKNPFRK